MNPIVALFIVTCGNYHAISHSYQAPAPACKADVLNMDLASSQKVIDRIQVDSSGDKLVLPELNFAFDIGTLRRKQYSEAEYLLKIPANTLYRVINLANYGLAFSNAQGAK